MHRWGNRVDWLVTEHLSAQARPDPKGRAPLFLVFKHNLNPPLDASDTLTIVENKLKMRKLQPPQSKGGQKLKKNKLPNTTKVGSLRLKKIPFVLRCYY